MQVLVGRPVSPGYAEGTAFVIDTDRSIEIPQYEIANSEVNGEVSRFHQALDRSCRELRQLERRVLAELGDAQSSIFSAHLGLLEDKQFTDRVKQRIHDELVNVEQALDAEVTRLARLMASLENEYLRERAQDIRDVGNRVMRQLARGESDVFAEFPPNSVLVAHELLPSETIDLDRRHVVAIVTEEGGENSHAAILARAMSIPAVTAVAGALSRIEPGTRLLVDGQMGRVIIAPTEVETRAFSVSKGRYDDETAKAEQAEELECVTCDGVKVSLLANINRPHEVRLVADHHLDGVGLFRTEFLYMESFEPPSYEQQQATYRQIVESLAGRPLVIRTLDLGGDKIPPFFAPHSETNPNLGLRGLRFSLANPELLETQLQAILLATDDQNVGLLFPMVLGASDLQRGIELAESLADELGRSKPPRIGAMIETPAAIFSLDEILQMADFVSIGTNDLTQFILAADRNAADLASDYSVLHPSVLRAIEKVIEAARDARREVCICGEAAGDPAIACLFVGLGADQLSMSPLRAARVRQAIRRNSREELAKIARKALRSDSPDEAGEWLRRVLGDKTSAEANAANMCQN